jgi:hypothetical protein
VHYSSVQVARRLRPTSEADLRAASTPQLLRCGPQGAEIEVPIRVQAASRPSRDPPAQSAPRKCNREGCGQLHVGSWSTHQCASSVQSGASAPAGASRSRPRSRSSSAAPPRGRFS